MKNKLYKQGRTTQMIYFDNAATTYPKPDSVKKAVSNAITFYGGNPGRSGHKISLKTAEKIFDVRCLIGDFFDAQPENVIFTSNCTHSLNTAILGVLKKGDHVITSSLEHNSMSRPLFSLFEKDVECSIVQIENDDEKTLENIENLIMPNTKVIAMTAGSNVTGQILPIKKIAKLCQKHNICFIVDGAQAGGVIPLKLSDGINILCLPGHKGLYGITGTGILLTDAKFHINPLMTGGTGATSNELEQTSFLPENLESGTINTVGILSLEAGVKFIRKIGLNRIHQYETYLCDILIKGLQKIKNVRIYRQDKVSYLPIVAFNFEKMTSSDLAKMLSDYGFALRGGLQCAFLTHKNIKTLETGVVRFSPSVFTKKENVYDLIRCLQKINKKL